MTTERDVCSERKSENIIIFIIFIRPPSYATGLLIARRALDLVGLADSITGVEEANAEEFHVEDEDNERKPFKVILDVGLTRTITGRSRNLDYKGGDFAGEFSIRGDCEVVKSCPHNVVATVHHASREDEELRFREV